VRDPAQRKRCKQTNRKKEARKTAFGAVEFIVIEARRQPLVALLLPQSAA